MATDLRAEIAARVQECDLMGVVTDKARMQTRIAELDTELAGVLKGASESQARWCIKRAQREVGRPLPNSLLQVIAPQRRSA